jgi:hypothetical protein
MIFRLVSKVPQKVWLLEWFPNITMVGKDHPQMLICGIGFATLSQALSSSSQVQESIDDDQEL